MKSTALVIILISEESYRPHADRIVAELDRFEVPHEIRIASTFRTPARLIAILEEYESDATKPRVYITIAGYSDALSGIADTRTTAPVIACPPVELDQARGESFPALSTPAGVAPLLVLGAQNAALAAIKILSLADANLCKKIERALQADVYRVVSADVKLNKEALQ